MKKNTLNLSARRFAVLALLGAWCLAGCATTDSGVAPTQYPSTMKDWHGIDSVQFLQAFQLGDYTRLVVEPLDTSAAVLPPADDHSYPPTVAVLKKSDQLLLTELQRSLQGQLAVSGPSDTIPPGKTLRLRGKVLDIHPGSQAARYWGG